MYKTKTTFIIGAGASFELGFPTGETLKHKIAELVDFRFEYNNLINGDHAVFESVRAIADYRKEDENKEANLLFKAGQHIARAMVQAISIDNFIENQEDERVTAVAKLGIASCLIDAEKICLDRFRANNFSNELIFSKLSETWIHPFAQSLTEGTRKSDIINIFNNTNFIIFNYDRSFEFFILRWIMNYYRIEEPEAISIVKTANFIHPYGKIGKLPWEHDDIPSQEFGSPDKRNLFDISQSILTFSEQISDKEQLGKLRDTVHEADQIVFLGFAFHDSNMQLLQPERTRDTARVVATAYNISKPDCKAIGDMLFKLCLKPSTLSRNLENGFFQDDTDRFVKYFILDNQSKCSSLFVNYRRLLLS